MYTFHADKLKACNSMAAGLYRAALNVRLRLQHEQERQHSVRHVSAVPSGPSAHIITLLEV